MARALPLKTFSIYERQTKCLAGELSHKIACRQPQYINMIIITIILVVVVVSIVQLCMLVQY